MWVFTVCVLTSYKLYEMKKAVHSIKSKLKKYVANQPNKNNERKARNSSNDITNKTTPVVQKVDSAIHWINHYPTDKAIGFRTTYPLDSDLSGG